MSTLKVNKLRDTAGSADAIVLDPNGGAVLAGVTTVTSVKVGAAVTISESGIEASGIGITCANINGTQIGGRRNKIINGGMTVSQRQTSSTSSSVFVVDRFKAEVTQMDELAQTLEQSSDAPDGFGKSLKITTTTPETAIAANEQFRIQTKLEGQDFQDLAYGGSSAKTITISFYVKASVTGTFGFTVYRAESTARVITAPYTISSADTWERKIITIPGDTAGAAITNDTSERFRLMWGLAAGSNFTTASASWGNYSSANLLGGHVTNTLVTTDNATWQLAGVQLEVGSQATAFEHRSFGEELSLCQRYYYRHATGADTSSDYSIATFATYQANDIFGMVDMPVTMRANPSIDQVTGTSYYKVYRDGGSDAFDSFGGVWSASPTCVGLNANSGTGVSGCTAGHATFVKTNNTSAYLAFSAEL